MSYPNCDTPELKNKTIPQLREYAKSHNIKIRKKRKNDICEEIMNKLKLKNIDYVEEISVQIPPYLPESISCLFQEHCMESLGPYGEGLSKKRQEQLWLFQHELLNYFLDDVIISVLHKHTTSSNDLKPNYISSGGMALNFIIETINHLTGVEKWPLIATNDWDIKVFKSNLKQTIIDQLKDLLESKLRERPKTPVMDMVEDKYQFQIVPSSTGNYVTVRTVYGGLDQLILYVKDLINNKILPWAISDIEYSNILISNPSYISLDGIRYPNARDTIIDLNKDYQVYKSKRRQLKRDYWNIIKNEYSADGIDIYKVIDDYVDTFTQPILDELILVRKLTQKEMKVFLDVNEQKFKEMFINDEHINSCKNNKRYNYTIPNCQEPLSTILKYTFLTRKIEFPIVPEKLCKIVNTTIAPSNDLLQWHRNYIQGILSPLEKRVIQLYSGKYYSIFNEFSRGHRFYTWKISILDMLNDTMNPLIEKVFLNFYDEKLEKGESIFDPIKIVQDEIYNPNNLQTYEKKIKTFLSNINFDNLKKIVEIIDIEFFYDIVQELLNILDTIIINAPKTDRNFFVFRGSKEKDYMNGNQNYIYESTTPVSTSYDIDIADDFGKNRYFTICNVVKDTNCLAIKSISAHPEEYEVIFPRYTKFKILQEFKKEPVITSYSWNCPSMKYMNINRIETIPMNHDDPDIIDD